MKNVLINAIMGIIEKDLVDRPILIWYDEEGTLINVISQGVPKNVEFILFQGSYLKIRARIESEDPKFERKWLIYIPEKPLDPSWIRDYELFGKRIDLNLERILVEKFGLVSDARIRELLSGKGGRQLATSWEEVMPIIKGKIKKPQIINSLLSIVFNLGSNFNIGRAILEYVTFTGIYLPSLEEFNLYDLFIEMIQQELGLDNTPSSAGIPAKNLAAAILFSELFVKSGKIGKEEFETLLPHEDKRTKWASLATEWQENDRLKGGFTYWSRELEQEYDVHNKLMGLESLLDVTSFRAVDHVLLQELCMRVGSDPNDLYSHLGTVKEIASIRREKIWSKIGEVKFWNVIDVAVQLLSECKSATDYLERSTEIGIDDFLIEYTSDNGWWKIDEMYLTLAKEDDIEESIRNLFVEPAIRAYFDWLRNLTTRFAKSVSKVKNWSSEKAVDQSMFWEKIVNTSEEPVAVFFIDALRYDLCKNLSQKLSEKGYQVETRVMLSSLPSITEIGMTALLPHEKKLKINVEKGKMLVSLEKKFLRNRSDRQRWLQDTLGKPVTFLNLDKILNQHRQTLKSKIQEYKYIIVMHHDIDKAGIFNPDITVKVLDQLVNKLAKAIHILHEVGIRRIVVGTDHGFLLIPTNFQLDLVRKVKVTSDVVKSRRYLIGKPPYVDALLQFPLAFANLCGDGFAMFSQGLTVIGDEVESLTFIHGGISLQENCIAALVSSLRPTKKSKVAIQAEIPGFITTMKFLIGILPLPEPGRDMSRSVHVEVYCKNEKIGESETIVIQKNPEKIRIALGKISPEVEIRIVDSDSREVLMKRMVEVKLSGYDDLL